MPETVTDRQCCHKCHKTVTGKRKLSKCARCHSITYCGQECQREDWPRHSKYCIPVMITEIPGKGHGLVASKNFKKGELIFKEDAIISIRSNSPSQGHTVVTLEMALALKEQLKNLSDEQRSKFYKLKPKQGYCDQNKIEIGYMANCLDELVIMYSYSKFSHRNDLLKLFVNCAFMNHSCAPNATLFQNLASGLEVVASKDISKGEEISHCFIIGTNFISQRKMKASLKKKYHFDCNCTVCTGEVPNQDEIRSELAPIMNSLPQVILKETGRQPRQTAWRVNVSRLERAVDLSKQLYIGDVFNRVQTLVDLVIAAQLAREPVLLMKTMDTFKDQIAGFEGRYREFNDLMKEVERWSVDFKLKSQPSKDEVECFFQLSSDNSE